MSTKLIIPEEIGHFEIENVEYTRDSKGLVSVDLEAHKDAMKRLGAVEYDPEVHGDDPKHVELPIDVDHATADALREEVEEANRAVVAKDEQLAAAHEANQALLERLERLEGAENARADAARTNAALGTTNASGDSSGQPGARADADAANSDKLAAELAKNPDFDAMKRDDMVTWLDKVGVVVPASISTTNARKAIDDTVADYRRDHPEA